MARSARRPVLGYACLFIVLSCSLWTFSTCLWVRHGWRSQTALSPGHVWPSSQGDGDMASVQAEAVSDGWKFLSSYPRHLLVHRLPPGDRTDRLVLDGRVDDTAWTELAEWHSTLVDLTHHSSPALDAVPSYQQARLVPSTHDRYLEVWAGSVGFLPFREVHFMQPKDRGPRSGFRRYFSPLAFPRITQTAEKVHQF